MSIKDEFPYEQTCFEGVQKQCVLRYFEYYHDNRGSFWAVCYRLFVRVYDSLIAGIKNIYAGFVIGLGFVVMILAYFVIWFFLG